MSTIVLNGFLDLSKGVMLTFNCLLDLKYGY